MLARSGAPSQAGTESTGCKFPSILEIVLETGASLRAALGTGKGGLGVDSYFIQILAFLNLLSALDGQAAVSVRSVSDHGSTLLYESWKAGTAQGAAAAVHAALLALAEREEGTDAAGPTRRVLQLSAALSHVLCHVNRLRRGGDTPARVLCVLASSEPSTQYIPLMNAVFAAQRDGVVMDCCKLGSGEARFAQHASQLTGGVYLKPSEPQALLQNLLMVFAAGPGARAQLILPTSAGVDGGATCMCHRRPLTMGHVCSVCLSVFCEPLPVCLTCGSEFVTG
ncbi:TFB4 [Auxenochlorella protothecoides x Auxenochlorella symbiontica]